MRLSEVPSDLLNKYASRGPRYTSYPTAPVWEGPFEGEWLLSEAERLTPESHLSLYQHIPFCRKRCTFCACNVIGTPREELADEYVDALIQEMDIVHRRLAKGVRAVQWHLGGGTPTYLSPLSMDKLLSGTEERFEFVEDAEKSIEVDSRITTAEHLAVLRKHGFNRISLGVQDFNAKIQEIIGRKQGFEETRAFVGQCRDAGFESVAIDLIYGLPGQSEETIRETLTRMIEIHPDRIAYYSYAHLPAKIPSQRRIDESLVPGSEERWKIFTCGADTLTSAGYVVVGMDHFALPQDALVEAQRKRTLQRNFMGFATRAGSELFAFGTTGITGLTGLYAQNTKKLQTYMKTVGAGQLPIERGWRLSEDDRIRRWVIVELLCRFEVSFADFKSRWGADFQNYFSEELEGLRDFIDDGLLEEIGDALRATPVGEILIRPIAMVFDAYLKSGKNKTVFSKTI